LKKTEDPPIMGDPSEISEPASAEKRSGKKRKAFRIEIYRAWCKACGICVAFCPTKVFTKEEDGYPRVAHPEACTGCAWCEIHCPDFAITVEEKKAGHGAE